MVSRKIRRTRCGVPPRRALTAGFQRGDRGQHAHDRGRVVVESADADREGHGAQAGARQRALRRAPPLLGEPVHERQGDQRRADDYDDERPDRVTAL